MKSALIVIPTTGANTLDKAVSSATSQTYKNTEVWVIIDGPNFEQQSKAILSKYPNVKYIVLPSNTGKAPFGDFYGHRIYGAVSFLFNHDYILYLDQDNFFESEHVERCINTCEYNNFQWCYSLRKIYDLNGNFICEDNCESLGKWPTYISDKSYLIDTSTYCIKREVIINIASAWYSGWGGDRRFYSVISQYFPNFGCTKKYSSCYRLDGNINSVTADFFIKGNEIMSKKYPMGFPWSV